MRSLFLFLCIFVQSISFIFASDDLTLEFENKGSWVSSAGATYDILPISLVSKKTTSRSLFCQIRYHDSRKINLHSFGLFTELTSQKTGRNFYFTAALVDIYDEGDNIKICIQSLGKEAKIEELKNHLKKLFLKSIIFFASRSVTGNEIQHIEGLIRPTRKQPKPSILSFLGF